MQEKHFNNKPKWPTGQKTKQVDNWDTENGTQCMCPERDITHTYTIPTGRVACINSP